MIELGQILTGLVKRTHQGRMKWSRTIEPNGYTTSVDAISIVIRLAPYDEDAEYYQLDILDEFGEPVESLTFFEAEPKQYDAMRELFVLARRSAHNIDTILEKLAKNLDLS